MEKEQKEGKNERLILIRERTNPHRKKDREEKDEERKKDNVIPGVGRKKRREASVSAIPGFTGQVVTHGEVIIHGDTWKDQ